MIKQEFMKKHDIYFMVSKKSDTVNHIDIYAEDVSGEELFAVFMDAMDGCNALAEFLCEKRGISKFDLFNMAVKAADEDKDNPSRLLFAKMMGVEDGKI